MNTVSNALLPEQSENTILLVDDEGNIIRSLKRILRKEGYSILTASSGKEGLKVLEENSVGVILSDQRMPEMSGTEFLTQVKERYPDTVRMVLSGYTDLNSITDAINRGAIYKFLTKPWEDDLLIANIKDAFKHYGLYKENLRLGAELTKLNEKLENRVDEQNRESQIKLRMLQFTQQVMDSQPIGVLGISDENIISMANHQAHEILAMSPGSLLMADALQVLPEPIQAVYRSAQNNEDGIDKQVVLGDIEIRVLSKKMMSKSDVVGIVLTLIKAH